MNLNLHGRDLLTLKDFTPEEITGLLDLAAYFKKKKKAGVAVDSFRGKNIALIFEKTSTRTRCSFEVAAHDLGIMTTYLAEGSQIGKKESIADTARVLSRMFDDNGGTASYLKGPKFESDRPVLLRDFRFPLTGSAVVSLRGCGCSPTRGLTFPNGGFHFPQRSKRPCRARWNYYERLPQT